MSEGSTIGERLRRLRGDRTLTQEELAEASGVSRELISMLERGARSSARLSTVSKLAHALDIEVSELVDRRDHLRGDRDGGSVLAVRDVLLSPSLLPGLDRNDDGEPTPVDQLRQSVSEAYRRYRAGDFGELLAVVPGLIGEARLTHSALGARTVEPLALAYDVAGALMTQIGRTDLGMVASERAVTVAHGGDDLLLWSWMHAGYSWTLLHQDRYEEAENLASSMAERIDPSFRDDDLEIAVWGNLLLTAVAPTVAQEHDPDEYLRLAGAGAERLGRRIIMYQSWFDSPSVAMQATYGYSTLKKPGKALEAAGRIRPPSPKRPGDLWGISWGAHLMDVAQAHLDAGHRKTAIRNLLDARSVSEVWFRHQRVAREAVTEIREQERRLSQETKSLVRSLDL